MVDVTPDMHSAAPGTGTRKQVWTWHPQLPLQDVPVFVWPPRPVAALRYLASLTFLGSILIPFAAVATFTWIYLQPSLQRCANLEIGWVLEIFGRNLLLMVVVAGGLQLYFYTFKRQGGERKFDPRDLAKNSKKFFTRNQVWDNVFWSCASGVTIWSAYEVFFM